MSKILGYKAFNSKFQCCPDSKPFKYVVGKTYTLEFPDLLELCRYGFHYCENPFNVLNYYNAYDSRFGMVESDLQNTKSHADDKSATSKIKIVKELSIGEFILECKKYLLKNKKNKEDILSVRKFSTVCNSTPGRHICSTGNYSTINTSGDNEKIFSSGIESSIVTTNSNSTILSSGPNSKIATLDEGSDIAFSGDDTVCSTLNDYAKINCQTSTGVIAALGDSSAVKGKIGTWFTLAEYNDGHCVHMASFYIDGTKIKEDVLYTLRNKKLIKWQ